MSLKPDATQADLRVCLLTTLRPFKQLGIQISEADRLLRKMTFHFAGSLPSQGHYSISDAQTPSVCIASK